MPIVGLTDGTPALKEIGRIRKGAEKEQFKPGANLDHFRVTFRNDENEAEQAFKKIYGDTPDKINVRLAYDTYDESFWAFWTCYLKGGMLGQADGQKWVYLRDYKTQQILVKGGELTELGVEKKIKLDFDENEPVYFYHSDRKKKDIPVFAKPEGRVGLMVPELGRYVFLTLLTHAKNDLGNLAGELKDIFVKAERLGIYPSDIPLVLSRRFDPVSKPAYNGEGRIMVDESLVHIETHEDFAKLAITYTQRQTFKTLTGEQPEYLPLPEQPPELDALPPGEEPQEDENPESWSIAPGAMFEMPPGDAQELQVEPTGENGGMDTPEPQETQGEPVVDIDTMGNNLLKWAEMYQDQTATIRHRNLLASLLTTCLDGDDEKRYILINALTGYKSTKVLPDALALAMLKTWLGVVGWHDVPSAEAIEQIKVLYPIAQKEVDALEATD